MINIGSNELAEAYIGSTPIAQINLGSQELWSSGLPVDGKFFQRITANGTIIGNGTAKVKKLKGYSGVWNQLCQNKYGGGMTQTHLGGSEYHYTNSNIQDSQRFFASKQYGETPYWIEGHKYYISWKIKKGSEDTTNHQWYALWNDQYYNVAPTASYVQYSYIAFGCEETPLQFWCQQNIGNVLDVYIKDYLCIDLTLLYGAGNEPTTVEQFKADYPLDYYDYNAGTLLNFKSNPNVSGWNQMQQNPIGTFDIDRTGGGGAYAWAGVVFPVCVIDHLYYFDFGIDFTSEDTFTNFYTNYGFSHIVVGKQIRKKTSDSIDKEIRFAGIPATMHITGTSYLKNVIDLTQLFGAGNEPTTVAEFEDWCRNYGIDLNQYQPYTTSSELKGTRIASYDSNNTFLDECKLPIASNNQPLILRSAGDVYDEVVGNKVTRRIGVRAYQSGDENDTTLLTDKTNTNYPLAIPTEETIPIWSNTYQAQNGGTETLLPSNTSVPYTNKVSGEIKYRKP